jgi:hypothetical protein
MEGNDRRVPVVRPVAGAAREGTAGEGPALRDAAAIASRVAEDQAEADRARDRFRGEPMAALEPDARIAPLLELDEQVVAMRRSALLERRQPPPGSDAPSGIAGDLYLTSRRLVLVGRLTLSFELADIEQVMLAGERLLLVMRDGQGAMVDAPGPRLLRVEIAAARAAARR